MEALDETNLGLQKEYNRDKNEMEKYVRTISDEIHSIKAMVKINEIGKNVLDKVKEDGILTAGAILCRNNGIYPYYITKAIAYAFYFKSSSDDSSLRMQQFIKLNGIKKAAERYGKLHKMPDLVEMICSHYKKTNEPDGFIEDGKRICLYKKAYSAGFYYEKHYSNCAQCTLAAAFDVTGEVKKEIFACASGLAGGMGGCTDGGCGGYSGGIMYMGSCIGRRYEHFCDGKDAGREGKAFEMGRKLHDKFIEVYGSVICTNIHKKIFGRRFDFADTIDGEAFSEMGGHSTKCTAVVGNASVWLTEMLIEEGILKVDD